MRQQGGEVLRAYACGIGAKRTCHPVALLCVLSQPHSAEPAHVVVAKLTSLADEDDAVVCVAVNVRADHASAPVIPKGISTSTLPTGATTRSRRVCT